MSRQSFVAKPSKPNFVAYFVVAHEDSIRLRLIKSRGAAKRGIRTKGQDSLRRVCLLWKPFYLSILVKITLFYEGSKNTHFHQINFKPRRLTCCDQAKKETKHFDFVQPIKHNIYFYLRRFCRSFWQLKISFDSRLRSRVKTPVRSKGYKLPNFLGLWFWSDKGMNRICVYFVKSSFVIWWKEICDVIQVKSLLSVGETMCAAKGWSLFQFLFYSTKAASPIFLLRMKKRTN